jgi:Resolvase, N terminal domain
MRIGYARVSTDDQTLDLQRDALKRAKCRQIYEEHAHCRSRLAAGILGQHRESADPAVQRTGSSDARIAYPLPGLTSTVLCETERSTSSNQPDFAGFESVIGQSGCIANLGPFL